MTVEKTVVLSCDWPSTCRETIRIGGTNGVKLRQHAKDTGWLRIDEFDFCGVPAYADLRSDPPPRHAARLDGHSFTATEHTEGIYRWQPGCECGWVCPPDAHALLTQQGTAYSRSSAAQVWLDTHVRQDLAALPPMWSRDEVEEYRAREDQYHARRVAERAEAEAKANEQWPANLEATKS